MPLQLILGSSGAGKSHKMLGDMIEKSLVGLEHTSIAIVPEQFTMQTQKDLVTLHPNKGMMNIDIVSFARLAFRIFEEAQEEAFEVLDDTGKNLILRKLIEEKKQELSIFKNKIKMPGFISEMKSMISELFQYDWDEDRLSDILEICESKPVLYTKFKDIKLIHTAFKDYLADKFITTEEIMELLCRHIPNSSIIKNSDIYIDGFTGFTPIQYKVLGLLMKHSKKVTISITLPNNRIHINEIREHHLFYLSKSTINRLEQVAKQFNVLMLPSHSIDDEIPYRFNENLALAYLEKNIFSNKKIEPYKGEQSISIHIAANPYGEAEFVAREIFTLIRDKGIQYRDIAVVTGDVEGYYRAFKEVFTLNDIPYFIDYKRELTTNPFIESIRAILEIMENRFSYESVFRYLRSGMINIDKEEIDLLDNYVLKRGIKGINNWKKDWDTDEECIQRIKSLVVTPLLKLYEDIKNSNMTAKDMTLSLYEYIVSQDMFSRLVEYRQEFMKENKIDLAKEYDQVYKLVMDLLDKIVILLGDEPLSFSEYRAIVEAGFEEIKVGIIPPTIDQIVIGDIERTRLNHIKILFFIGVNDGIVPKSQKSNGILSESEREYLARSHVELSPTARESSFIQKFYLYLNMTKPTDRLIVSFSKASASGTSLRPSYLINQLVKMYPEISIIEEEKQDKNISNIISEYAGLKFLSDEIREYTKKDMTILTKDLYSLFFTDQRLNEKVKQLIDASFFRQESSKLDKAVASALYGTCKTNSVSRMEKYASCAYNHFLSYGLALVERKEYAIEAVDLGNLYHNSIELFSKKLENSSFDFTTLPDEFRDQLVNECVDEVTKDYRNTVLLSSARNAYIIKRVKRITGRTVWALSEHIKRGKFVPAYYELAVGHGRIDRVDTYDDGNNLYIKIIDYKTGSKMFNIVDTYYNLQLQLLIYMKDVMDIEKDKNTDRNIIPAAIGYYQIKDPIINKGEELLEQFQMSGLINSSDQVIEAIETDLEGKSIVFPINRKNGKLYNSTNLVSNEDFHLLLNHVQESVNTLNNEIFEGNIQVNPYAKNSFTSCDYCSYQAVCGFDPKLSSFSYRKVDELKAEDVWHIIKGDEQE